MRQRHVLVRGLRLNCLEWGSAAAPPVLLLHGGSAHGHWWDGVAPALADRFRVLALELRGHGDSEWARPAAYDVDDYAADVAALVEQEDLRTLRLVGHSLGGLVAAAAAALVSGRMAALAIVDSRTAPFSGGLRSLHRLAQLPSPRWRTRAEAIARYRLLPDDGATSPETRAHVAAHAVTQETGGAWTYKFDRAALAAIRPYDAAPALARIGCPVLALRGALSPMMSARALEALRAAAPQLEVATIDGAHHHVMLDRPAEFSHALGHFLDRSAAAPVLAAG
jgi:pimeloyl-ACP methyl ester carboxylesterase